MKYVEVAPRAALAAHVQCFWASEGMALAGESSRVLPDGCVDILVDLGDGGPHAGTARVVGAMQTASVVPLHGHISLLGVRFRPGGAVPFLRLRLDEVTDADAPLECFWGRDGAALASRLADTPGLAARVRLLEEHLLARWDERRSPDAAVTHATALILEAGGAVPVSTVREAVGLSERTLERRFRAVVGLGPKVLCRVARLQRVVDAARGQAAPEWAGLALEGGYFDQAHLVREFRALAGTTPGAWARERAARVGSVQDAGLAAP